MREGDTAQREEQVVDQAEDRRQAKCPVPKAEPEVEQDGRPACQDGVHRTELGILGKLAIEDLQPLRLRTSRGFLLCSLKNRLELGAVNGLAQRQPHLFITAVFLFPDTIEDRLRLQACQTLSLEL